MISNTKLKNLIKKIIPKQFLKMLKRFMTYNLDKNINNLSNKDKFSFIYRNRLWGKGSDNQKFFSGNGSHNHQITQPYIKVINKLLDKKKIDTIVDLGCGDFTIGSNFLKNNRKYYGIDIVEDLIKLNKEKFISDNLEFISLDITKDNLPSGQVCLIRQVLQHLSNKDISMFLKNINNKYDYLVVTEHLPSGNFKPNIDMPTTYLIREINNSGVVLHEEPFLINFKKKENILETSAAPDKGIILTTLYSIKSN